MGIEVLARDWDRPEWCGTFYPHDLPEDWRLAYFATVFDTVLVPAGTWQGAAPGHLAHWLADVPRRFRFYLELDAGGSPAAPALVRAAATLGEHFAGCLAAGPGPDHSVRTAMAPAAWDAVGVPLAARRIPDDLAPDTPAALHWLRQLAATGAPRPALAILGDARAATLTDWCQLVALAGLA